MKILVVGGEGQLGRALRAVLADHELTSVDLPEFDMTDRAAVERLMADRRPEVVINAAAYTDVDGCVRQPELAHRANALGPQNLALACLALEAALVQVSTNEVFDGCDPAGYEEWRPLSPINAYGRSKAAGEFNVRAVLPRHYIVRTAWLYAPGGRNFIHAILRRARETGRLRVVTDEIGNPTLAGDLAAAIARLVETGRYGTYHFVNQGACSRWAFANEILRQAGLSEVTNEPILSSEFVRASTPPPFGLLHNLNGAALGIALRPWQEALAAYLREEAPVAG